MKKAYEAGVNLFDNGAEGRGRPGGFGFFFCFCVLFQWFSGTLPAPARTSPPLPSSATGRSVTMLDGSCCSPARGLRPFSCAHVLPVLCVPAEAYAAGEAEVVMGECVKRGISDKVWERSDLILTTKIFFGTKVGVQDGELGKRAARGAPTVLPLVIATVLTHPPRCCCRTDPTPAASAASTLSRAPRPASSGAPTERPAGRRADGSRSAPGSRFLLFPRQLPARLRRHCLLPPPRPAHAH